MSIKVRSETAEFKGNTMKLEIPQFAARLNIPRAAAELDWGNFSMYWVQDVFSPYNAQQIKNFALLCENLEVGGGSLVSRNRKGGYLIMNHSFTRERDGLRITENLAITPKMFSLILSKIGALERDRMTAGTDPDVVSNLRTFVDFDFATIQPEPDSEIELVIKLTFNRYSPTSEPEWILSLQYRFDEAVVRKVRDDERLSDQERAKHLGVLRYSRIRLPYVSFVCFMKGFGSGVLRTIGFQEAVAEEADEDDEVTALLQLSREDAEVGEEEEEEDDDENLPPTQPIPTESEMMYPTVDDDDADDDDDDDDTAESVTKRVRT